MRISDWSSDVCSSDLVGSYRGSSLFCGSPPCGRPNTAQPSRSHLVHGNALGITDPHRHRDAGAHALGEHAEVLELGEDAIEVVVLRGRFGQMPHHLGPRDAPATFGVALGVGGAGWSPRPGLILAISPA